jgi:hypothetical protein
VAFEGVGHLHRHDRRECQGGSPGRQPRRTAAERDQRQWHGGLQRAEEPEGARQDPPVAMPGNWVRWWSLGLWLRASRCWGVR